MKTKQSWDESEYWTLAFINCTKHFLKFHVLICVCQMFKYDIVSPKGCLNTNWLQSVAKQKDYKRILEKCGLTFQLACDPLARQAFKSMVWAVISVTHWAGGIWGVNWLMQTDSSQITCNQHDWPILSEGIKVHDWTTDVQEVKGTRWCSSRTTVFGKLYTQ